MAVCRKCGAESPEGFRFCGNCGVPLAVESVLREQRKTVTVLFCDVTGSTALGESLDPESLRALLARYFERMRAIVERHGGSVEKFIGDAVMAVFGVPRLHEDDALRALRAASEMRGALPELGVQGRIGVATGEVVTGTEERLATGDAVNVAARLQQAAAPGEVLVGSATVEVARGVAVLEPVGPLELKGKAEPVHAYRLLEVREVPQRPHETTFVGRARELGILANAWERVRSEQRCELVTIVGDAGVGKSRLVAEFLRMIDATAVRGRCLPYGEGITYWPVVEVLKQLDILPSDPTAAAAIQALLGQTEAPTSADEIAWAFRKTLEQSAKEHPLVVVFDDIQWGEERFLDLIEHVALLSTGAGIVLVCMARPELRDRRSAWPVTVALTGLADDEVDILIPAGMPTDLRDHVARAAGGNPLFVEEMVAVASSAGEVVVPPTLRALIGARLDQLDPAERSVLERAAVEGEVFHRGAVQALASADTMVTPRLAALVRTQLIHPDRAQLPGEDGFRFRHLLIRDAAYEALPKALRAELHARFAEWLQGHGADQVELDEILGYHQEQACAYRAELGLEPPPELRAAARRHLVAAAHRALMRDDASAAALLLRRASGVDESDFDVALELDLADALADAGDFESGLRSAEAAAERAEDAGDRLGALCLRIEQGLIHSYSEPEGANEALVLLVDAAALEFQEAGHDLGMFLCSYARGEAAHHLGKADIAARYLDEAYEHARRMGSPHHENRVLGWRIVTRYHGSMPATAFLGWLKTVPTHARSNVVFVGCQAQADAMCGRADRAREALRRLARDLEERGATLSLAVVLALWIAETEFVLGDPQAALNAGIRGCELFEQLSERSFHSSAAANVAHALYMLDRLDDADAWARKSAELGASDDALTQLAWRLVSAKVLARRGTHNEAAVLIEEALAVAHGIEQPHSKAIAEMDAAEVHTLAGRAGEAQKALRRALDLARSKGNLPMAARIEDLLAASQRGEGPTPSPSPRLPAA